MKITGELFYRFGLKVRHYRYWKNGVAQQNGGLTIIQGKDGWAWAACYPKDRFSRIEGRNQALSSYIDKDPRHFVAEPFTLDLLRNVAPPFVKGLLKQYPHFAFNDAVHTLTCNITPNLPRR